MCKFILRISFTLLKSLTFCWRLLRSLFQLDSRSCCSSSRCSSFIWRKSCSFYCCVCDFFILSIASSYSFLLSFICCSSCWRCCFPCFTACCSTAFSVWSLFSTATFRGQLLFVWDLGSSGCVSWFGHHSDPSALFPLPSMTDFFVCCSSCILRASICALFVSCCCCFSCASWSFVRSPALFLRFGSPYLSAPVPSTAGVSKLFGPIIESFDWFAVCFFLLLLLLLHLVLLLLELIHLLSILLVFFFELIEIAFEARFRIGLLLRLFEFAIFSTASCSCAAAS